MCGGGWSSERGTIVRHQQMNKGEGRTSKRVGRASVKGLSLVYGEGCGMQGAEVLLP